MAKSIPWTTEVELVKNLFDEFEVRGCKQEKEEVESQDVVVVDNYDQWEQAQRVCRKERKVIALEITNPFNESCGRVRPLFTRFAKEFKSVCIRVVTGPFPVFLSLEKVCQDIGPVKELPAILLLYYDQENHIKRKSYEGERTIQTVLLNGQLKRKFKEFIDQRLHQMKEGSLRETEKAYQKELGSISRSISKDDLAKSAQCMDGDDEGLDLPSTIPEEKENQNDTDHSSSRTMSSYVAKEPEYNRKADDDDVLSENTSVKVSIPLPSPGHLSMSYAIDRKDIKVGERIGQGGFGTVFKATWRNERKVAVKSCNGNLLEYGASEVKILASLPQHPNVLRFFGVALSQDRIQSLIVTELAFGGSLYVTLHGEGREEPSADQSLGWAFQIASGMEHLHKYNIIHRDLKSPNVLLSHGYAKLCDFGTARELSKTCGYICTRLAGTYRWMAPEVGATSVSTVNRKCDVFSYAMILYEIYALKIPFEETKSDIDVYCKLMNGERPPIPDKLPAFLSTLLQDCWSKEPEQRPSFERIVFTMVTEVYEKE